MTALYPMGLAIVMTLVSAGIAAIQVLMLGGAVDATFVLRLWPVTLIIAAPTYLLMIWWLLRNWRE